MNNVEILNFDHYTPNLALRDALGEYSDSKGVIVLGMDEDGAIKMNASSGLTNAETAWMLERCLRLLHSRVDEEQGW